MVKIVHYQGGSISIDGPCPVSVAECTREYNGDYSTSCPCDYALGYAPARYPVPALLWLAFDDFYPVFD